MSLGVFSVLQIDMFLLSARFCISPSTCSGALCSSGKAVYTTTMNFILFYFCSFVLFCSVCLFFSQFSFQIGQFLNLDLCTAAKNAHASTELMKVQLGQNRELHNEIDTLTASHSKKLGMAIKVPKLDTYRLSLRFPTFYCPKYKFNIGNQDKRQ